MTHLSNVLTVLGGVCEASGILLTVRELVSVENRAFPERRGRLVRMVRRTELWVRERFGRVPHTQAAALQGTASAHGSASGVLTVGRAEPNPHDLRARLLRLEKVVEDHERMHRADLERVETRVENVERKYEKALDALRRDIQQTQAAEREALQESLALQKAYALLFTFGVVLSTAGGLSG